MISKIFSNKHKDHLSLGTIMREDLRHRAWMIALSLLGSFLASPVAFLFYNRHSNRYMYPYYTEAYDGATSILRQTVEIMTRNLLSYLNSAHLILQMIVLFAGAVIVAVFGFRHLYSRRMVDLYHGMPVTRGRLFLAHWLNGFLIWLVPFLIGNLCVYLLALLHIRTMFNTLPGSRAAGITPGSIYGSIGVLLLCVILLCILCFLIVYNACLVAVMLSGNIMNALVNLLAYGLVVFIGNVTILLYMNSAFSTYLDRSELYMRPLVMALSPLASPLLMAYRFSEGAPLAEWLGTLLLTTLFMVFNFILAMMLHRGRSSELAERGLEAKWFRIPMRFALSCLSGLLMALFFTSFTGSSIGWCLFGAIFGSTLAFTVLNIIYHGGFKFLLCHKLQLALAVLITCGIGGIFAFDVFGYDAYLPDASQITGLSLYSRSLTGNSYPLKRDENGGYYRSHTEFPDESLRFTDADAIHRLLEVLTEQLTESYGGNTTTLYVHVSTRHGGYYRRYFLHNDEKAKEALRPFVESEEYRNCYYPASTGSMLPQRMQITHPLPLPAIVIDDPERIRQLYEACRKDFLEQYSISTLPSDDALYGIRYLYPVTGQSTVTASSSFGFNLYFSEGYHSVKALLQKWYPDYIWSVEELTPEALKLQLHTRGDSPAALYEYFGLSDDRQQDAAEDGYATPGTADVKSYYLEYRLTDPGQLAEWKPYLRYAKGSQPFFCDKDYLYIGQAEFIWEPLDNYKYYMECFVEKGNLPGELLEYLKFIRQQTEFWQ